MRTRMMAGTATLLLLATGCLSDGGGESTTAEEGADAIAEAAAEEGTVTWYSSLPQGTTDALVAGFESEHDVEVEAVVLASSLLTSRIASERDSGTYDVDVINAADPVFMDTAYDDEWFAEIDADEVPALDAWPEDALYDNAYALVNIQPQGISFNTDKVSADDVDTWEELLAPNLRGEIFVSDPRVTKSWLVMMDLLDEEIEGDYISDLAAQNIEIVDSPVSASQNLAAGAKSVLFSNLVAVVNPLKEEGAPIDIVFPQPTTGVEQFSAVMDTAPHPNAARLFMDYLISEEGQKVMNAGSGSSPLGDLDGTLPLPEGYVSPDFERANEKEDDLVGRLVR